MATALVRVSARTHKLLKELAKRTGESMPAVLDKAVEAYRRQRFLDGLSRDFRALKKDSKAWAAERRERADWDATLADGLEDE